MCAWTTKGCGLVSTEKKYDPWDELSESSPDTIAAVMDAPLPATTLCKCGHARFAHKGPQSIGWPNACHLCACDGFADSQG